jgi:hypothetical protein
MALRDDILTLADATVEPVVLTGIKGWETVKLFVRTMSASERDKFEAWCIDLQTKQFDRSNIRARLAVLTACDEQGQRLFSNEDEKQLGTKSAAALDRIFTVATKLNGLSKSDVAELEKN